MALIEETPKYGSIDSGLMREIERMVMVSFDPSADWMSKIRSTRSGFIPDKPSTSMLQSMVAPELGSDARSALAVEVEDLLGYTPLRKSAGAPSRLQRLLAELEIEAFDQKSVDEYCTKMRAHFQAKADERDRIRNDSERMRMNLHDPPWMVGKVRTVVVWHAVDLGDYSKPVPEFVLNKALQIKRRASDATFEVVELREQNVTLDPFLYVLLGGERLAIEVWDEPEFEKTL